MRHNSRQTKISHLAADTTQQIHVLLDPCLGILYTHQLATREQSHRVTDSISTR